LVDVQKMLTQFGIVAHIYKDNPRDPQRQAIFTHTRRDGEQVQYTSSSTHWRLTITSRQIEAYARYIGFTLSHKAQRLEQLASTKWLDANSQVQVRLVNRVDDGVERTYNLTEPRNHSYVVDGVVVSNCGEFVYINNTACNLASINLLKYYDDDAGTFDADSFVHDCQVVLTGMELLVDLSDYPTEEIAANSHRLRPLGLGYTNLGALLMRMGLPYDSDEGREVAAAITALMGGAATVASVQFAQHWGAYEGYEANRRSQLRILQQHLDAARDLATSGTPKGSLARQLAEQAQQLWAQGVENAKKYGIRNGQTTLLAPTGTISFLMGADTTGVEPDLALSKRKKLVGGGEMQIVNQSVLPALRRLGYTEADAEIIAQYMRDNNTPEGAPGLDPKHYTVFACAMATPTISPMGHVAMMGAVQPFLSGAISKTVNMPADSTIEDVAEVYFAAWQAGCKDIAIYRDNSKLAQPLSAEGAPTNTNTSPEMSPAPRRRKLPGKRNAVISKFSVGGLEGYLTVGLYDDGTPGEVFIKTSKQGSTLEGVMDGLAIVMSLGLQYGVPLEAFVQKFIHTKFDPAGLTEDPELRMATSLLDYIARRLACDHLPTDVRHALGIKTTAERTLEVEQMIPTAPAPAPAQTPMKQPTAVGTHICASCGGLMNLHGSCWLCEGCGSTSGCS
jgi:ribonucleoside-diphosphate reductase alpha chain